MLNLDKEEMIGGLNKSKFGKARKMIMRDKIKVSN